MIKELFRRRSLRKFGSHVQTAITPLSQIKSAVVLVDSEENTFEESSRSVQEFFRKENIKVTVFFLDFRKLSSSDRLITSIKTTILKKDLNWFGKPNAETISYMHELNPDLFVSLVRGSCFPLEFMAVSCKAKFKVGREQLKGQVFDFIVSEKPDHPISQSECFELVKTYITKIS